MKGTRRLQRIGLATGVLAALLLWVNPVTVNAGNGGNESRTYYIRSPRFARPLMEKLIAEYQKEHPEADFRIASGKNVEAALSLAYQDGQAEAGGEKPAYFAEYAILPVANATSAAAQYYAKKKLNVKELKNLFFIVDEFAKEKVEKNLQGTVVYSAIGPESISGLFAGHYGFDASRIKGKRISGDDAFLSLAVGKDPQGVTFNALPNLFDLESRQLKPNLALIPVGLDRVKQGLNSTATLDELVGLLQEAADADEIPIERIGLTAHDDDDSQVKEFVAYVLDKSPAYNHAFGFLNLSE